MFTFNVAKIILCIPNFIKIFWVVILVTDRTDSEPDRQTDWHLFIIVWLCFTHYLKIRIVPSPWSNNSIRGCQYRLADGTLPTFITGWLGTSERKQLFTLMCVSILYAPLYATFSIHFLCVFDKLKKWVQGNACIKCSCVFFCCRYAVW